MSWRLVIGAVAALVLACAPNASAALFCVNVSPCSGGTSEASLTQAISDAGSSADASSTIALGAGTYPGPFSYTGSKALVIAGVGPSANITVAGGQTGLTLDGNAGDAVSNLAITIAADSAATGLSLQQGTGMDLSIAQSTDSSAAMVFGAQLGPGTSLTHSTVALPLTGTTAHTYAVYGDSGAGAAVTAVADDTLVADQGVDVLTNDFSVLRTSIHTHLSGVFCQAALCDIQDSLIVADAALAEGVAVQCQFASSASASLENDTLIGPGTGPGIASFGVLASCGQPSRSATATVASTVLSGIASVFAANGSSPSTITPSYCAFDPARVSLSGAGASVATDAHVVTSAPLFINPSAGDYHIPWNSPLVDAGVPGALSGSDSVFDLGGNPRLVNGRRDIGAYEYQRLPPTASIAPSNASATTGQTITFDGTKSSDPDDGDTLTYAWSVDNGPTVSTGGTFPTAFSTVGAHKVTLTVTDPTGLANSMSATVTVTAPPSGGKGTGHAPSLTAFRETATTFRRGNAAARITRHGRPPVGTTFSLKLDQAARIKLTFTTTAKGRTVTAGTLTFTGHSGVDKIYFDGRLRHGKLPLGSYTVTAIATNTAGASSPATLKFKILK
jgi:hypothetical protein